MAIWSQYNAALPDQVDGKDSILQTDSKGRLIIAGSATATAVLVTSGGSLAADASGTITSGGVAQNALAANTARHEWTFVNNSDLLMMLRVGGTASATAGIPVYPGDVVTGQETNAISVYGATTGKAFTAWER